MADWKTVGVRLREEEVGSLNIRLKQFGYETLGDFVRAVALGQIDPSKLANSDFADQLAVKIVNQQGLHKHR